MDAVDTSTEGLLSSLMHSMTSVSSAFPSGEESLLPPADGISLLDTKNEILLSYIHNLVFLIILRLRHAGETQSDSQKLGTDAVKKLVELRVYLEKGVRPLEGRLKYQIDKVLRAAEEVDRISAQTGAKKSRNAAKSANGVSKAHDSSDESHSSSDTDASSTASQPDIDELSYRPNPAALLRKPDPASQSATKSRQSSNPSAPYKPPRITPTAMPLPPSSREPTRKRKSHLLDEYIDAEISTAPQAQPSIGSNNTILNRGRGSLSARQRAKEKERTEYEEQNFTRLPAESKAEKRKARLRGEGGGRRDMFGGEDWTGLGGLGDRVVRSVSGKGGSGVVERREKRRRETVDGQRGDGVGMQIGESFETRKRVLQGRAEKRRKTGRRDG
jgi:U3 small nucleolar ribonucleoprotein protein LCP5